MLPTPDGIRYLALGAGRRVPYPFHLRWLLPRLCGTSYVRWCAATVVGAVLLAVGTFGLADRWEHGAAAAVMVLVLPGVRYNYQAPVLVDLPALGLAACAGAVGWWPAAVVLACVSGACKESGPVFAALFAWSPVPLVGLAVVAVRVLMRPGTSDPIMRVETVTPKPELAWIAAHPWQAGWKYHQRLWLSPVMVLPWGGALAVLGNLDAQVVAVLAVAYMQLLRATDTVRLYQWAGPVVCVAACVAVPLSWLPLLVVVTVWNPFAGDGV